MRPPSRKEATGYDIVVWVDDDGDVVTRAYTERGHSALRRYVNKYEKGDIVQIYVPPGEFQADMSGDLAIGLLGFRGVRPMRSAALH